MGFAKKNFCWINGDCTLNNLTVQNYINVTYAEVLINITGFTGDLNASHFHSINCSSISIGNQSNLCDELSDTVGENWVNESGDTMSGNLNMSDNEIIELDKITFKDNVKIDTNELVQGTNNIILGKYSRATADTDYSFSAIARSEVNKDYSTAIGYFAEGGQYGGIALGYHSIVDTPNDIGVKYYSIAVGPYSKAVNNYGIALGYWANSSADHSIAIGSISKAINDKCTAIGYNAKCSGIGSVCIGAHCEVTEPYTLKLGNESIEIEFNKGNINASGNSTFVKYCFRNQYGQYIDCINMTNITQALVDTDTFYRNSTSDFENKAINGSAIYSINCSNIDIGNQSNLCDDLADTFYRNSTSDFDSKSINASSFYSINCSNINIGNQSNLCDELTDAGGFTNFSDITVRNLNASFVNVSGQTVAQEFCIENQYGQLVHCYNNTNISIWGGQVLTYNATRYVDRGDPVDYDFNLADFTTDAIWRDLDLSAIVPAGAKSIVIQYEVNDDVSNSKFRFRKNGINNAYNYVGGRTQVGGITTGGQVNVACAENRSIEYYFDNLAYTGIWLVVNGWYVEDEYTVAGQEVNLSLYNESMGDHKATQDLNMNNYSINDLNWSFVDVYRNSAQTIATGTWTIVNHSTIIQDNLDEGNITDNAFFTAKENGEYLLCVGSTWQNANSAKLYMLRLLANGRDIYKRDTLAGNMGYLGQEVCGVWYLNEGDSAYHYVYQNSGGNEDIWTDGNDQYIFAFAHRIGG